MPPATPRLPPLFCPACCRASGVEPGSTCAKSFRRSENSSSRVAGGRLHLSRLAIIMGMMARELLRVLRSHGCVELRQKGSHVRVWCGKCLATVPVHAGEDVGLGLMRKIDRDLEPCLGKGWLRP